MTIHSRTGCVFLAGLLAASLVAAAQQAHIMPERDKNKEEAVATLFEAIRAEAKLPHLTRIMHRPQLEQAICTTALTSEPPKGSRGFAFYTTTDPQSVTAELKTIAQSNPLDRHHAGKPVYERYAIAVWRTEAPPKENANYWVGIGVYGSAVGEFVDCHFTDDVHYCGMWKESIARPCRGK